MNQAFAAPSRSNARRRAISLVFSLVAFFAAAPFAALAAGDEVFRGEIADSQCALNVHSLTQSHKEMLEAKNAGSTPADCVWYCVKERGGRFVLQNKEKVYRLDVQNLSKDYAGRKVRITGTLDTKTNTIHVKSVDFDDATPIAEHESAAPPSQ